MPSDKQLTGTVPASSPHDSCNYRLITLPNQLTALLVSSAGLDKSSAALAVKVGSFQDTLFGLAHFLEHLLFMGTEKYPKENEYMSFLAEHGGSSNAFTADDRTNYFFDVAADSLEPALDRFAQFFICPLFNPSGTERELNAVDSEHRKNLQSDPWRLRQVERSVSSHSHPYNSFGTGNMSTLKDIPLEKGIDVRAKLLDFHKTFYSANIMKLVIYGRETLDELEALVVKYFSNMNDNAVTLPRPDHQPLAKEHLQKFIQIKPVKDLKRLMLLFQLPDPEPFLLTKPSKYFSHLIGHEGKGSILSSLKAKGFASALGAGEYEEGPGFELFAITIELTPLGYENYPQVIETVFQYINMLKSVGIQKWIFDECAQLGEMEFTFAEKCQPMNFTYQHADNLCKYAPENCLNGPYVMPLYDESSLNNVMKAFSVDNFRVTLISQREELKNVQVDPWYGTEYCVNDLDTDLLERLKNVQPSVDFHLPSKNLYIPTDFSLLNAANTPQLPTKILESENVTVWFKQDDKFKLPKANVSILLSSPIAYNSPLCAVKSFLVADYIKDELTEETYAAQLAGLSFSFTSVPEGFELVIRGFNDKLFILLETILQALNKCEPMSQLRFAAIKDRYARHTKNTEMDPPYSLARFYNSQILQSQIFDFRQRAKAIEQVTIADLERWKIELCSQIHYTCLAHGNFSKDIVSEKLVAIISRCKNIYPLGSDLIPVIRNHEIPKGHFVFCPPATPDINSALHIYYQFGQYVDLQSRTLCLLLCQILKEAFFNQLRTIEQLGYVTTCNTLEKNDTIGLTFLIQSEKNPIYLSGRVQSFLESQLIVLKEMRADEFALHKSSLKSTLLEEKKKLAQETDFYWSQIRSTICDFPHNISEAAALDSINQEAVVAAFEKYLVTDARKLSIHLTSSSNKEQLSALEAVTLITVADKSRFGILPVK